jgi:hypothetical protein
MNRCVIDTNVAIVANGRPNPNDLKTPSINCRIECVMFLMEIAKNGRVLLDAAGAIQAEYRRHLNPTGAPGVGDRFYQIVLQSSPHLVERVDLPKRPDGEYQDLPQSLIDAAFDHSDRKFAALANNQGVTVHNASDSDWIHKSLIFEEEGIQVNNLCGCDPDNWFTVA